MEKKLVAVQLTASQLEKLAELVEITGWNQSEVIRQLIDAAYVKPPAVRVEVDNLNGHK